MLIPHRHILRTLLNFSMVKSVGIDSNTGKYWGIFLGTMALILSGICSYLAVAEPINLTTLLFATVGIMDLLTAVVVFVLTAALNNASFQIFEDQWQLNWGGMQITIPSHLIVDFVSGHNHETVRAFQGLRWPGLFIGQGRVKFANHPELPTFFLAAGTISSQWFIITPQLAIGISPQDPHKLANNLPHKANEILQSQNHIQVTLHMWGWTLWNDRLFGAMNCTAVAINLLLLAILCALYPQLPTDTITPQYLFMWPLTASAVWLLNIILAAWFHQQHQEPFMGYLLASGSIVIQIAAVLITLNSFAR